MVVLKLGPVEYRQLGSSGLRVSVPIREGAKLRVKMDIDTASAQKRSAKPELLSRARVSFMMDHVLLTIHSGDPKLIAPSYKFFPPQRQRGCSFSGWHTPRIINHRPGAILDGRSNSLPDVFDKDYHQVLNNCRRARGELLLDSKRNLTKMERALFTDLYVLTSALSPVHKANPRVPNQPSRQHPS
ncbi:uncharacterized protein BT62DRAFT_1011050 [Guyanagaster necrorhizus]|uniref:Uncharacterized protein n=1 Tax=Guyanagaster necrorhizus TaxID=856835 RepID=A0A9P8AN71_9AGAR|nr:uncharacterized protein BT62DRAFT_1011050 [Guyanagaster necrorhizus MCA 3950]KAG7442008.1 hypothetical protein BT62DRAFT_1011050 [Guyanagaster necrorhizus MCA 3950]